VRGVGSQLPPAPTEFNPWTVTNLSTKRDRRRVSLLTFTTPLPLSQTDKHFSACPSSWKIVPSKWRIIFRWADEGESCVTMVRTSLQRIACQHHWCVVMTTATNSSSSSGAEPGNIADRYISMPLSTALMNWQLACIMSHDRWAIAFGTARTVSRHDPPRCTIRNESSFNSQSNNRIRYITF